MARGGDTGAVGAVRDVEDRVVVADLEHLAAGGDVPDTGRVVMAAGDDAGAVRAEGDAENGVVVADFDDLRAGGDVPDAAGLVLARGGDLCAVRAERHREHRLVVADFEDLAPGGDIPDTGGPVLARGGDAGAVRAERHPPSTALPWRTARISAPVPTSQRRAVLLSAPVTSRVPSGPKATAYTQCTWGIPTVTSSRCSPSAS
ncbi:hypothetical protein GCM10020000_00980 [Streptomyces olivoverticillatus]